MDMQDGIKVCVGNYGYSAEGDLRDDWITLPKSDEQIKEFLQSRGLQDVMHEEIYISDYDEVPFGNSQLFGETVKEAYKAEHSEDLSNHGSAAPEKEATGLDALSVKAAEARAAVDNLKDARGAIDTHSIDPR